MIEFINIIIIKCSKDAEENCPQANNLSGLSTPSQTEFNHSSSQDSSAITKRCHVHFTRHRATCYKYGEAATGKCRFNFPRPLVDGTTINSLGTIDIERNNVWVNPFNPTILLWHQSLGLIKMSISFCLTSEHWL